MYTALLFFKITVAKGLMSIIFYRTMLCRARYLLRQSSVSVCLLRYHDHIRWNFSKIISLLASLGCSLFADRGDGNKRGYGLPVVSQLSASSCQALAFKLRLW